MNRMTTPLPSAAMGISVAEAYRRLRTDAAEMPGSDPSAGLTIDELVLQSRNLGRGRTLLNPRALRGIDQILRAHTGPRPIRLSPEELAQIDEVLRLNPPPPLRPLPFAGGRTGSVPSDAGRGPRRETAHAVPCGLVGGCPARQPDSSHPSETSADQSSRSFPDGQSGLPAGCGTPCEPPHAGRCAKALRGWWSSLGVLLRWGSGKGKGPSGPVQGTPGVGHG